MKIFKSKYSSLFIVLFSLQLAGCSDFDSINIESQSNDQVDFSIYVAVGNSLTAGFQSSALYQLGQENSFPNLLARQMHVVDSFEQPLISEPGIGARIQLDDNLNPTSTGDGSGTPLNSGLNRPFNNLGIPGTILADFTGADLPGLPYAARQEGNPFLNVVLRDFGNTQAEQMAALEPTFVSFFQGNNDVLGYVTSGGSVPFTPPQNFEGLYQASINQITATGADAIVFNIPDVTSIPFVFLINQTLLQGGTLTINGQNNFALVTPQGNVPIWIQRTDPANPGAVQDTVQMSAPNAQAGNPGSFFLLSSQSRLADLFSQGIGLSPQNPILSPLILDSGEALQALQLVASYNNSISSLANSVNFAMVDVNSIFNEIIENGSVSSNGITLAPVPGSLFSFDGVYPSNRGYGILTNETIEVINDRYGTDLRPVDISTIPQGLPVTAN
jgi:hypothetical protein